MAEDSRFWTTNGTGDGTGSGYTTAKWAEFVRQTMTTAPASEGVLYGILNSLAVSGTSSPVSIASGSAIGYGYFYTNDASTTQAIATPTTATRIDRIVLRASWSAQTVRITRIAGTEGSGSAPAMTQTAGTTWDIPLATVSITTGGVITVTDARTFCKSPLAYGWFSQALSVAGNVSAAASSSGGTVQLVAQNTSNTANSAARALITVAGSSAADPYVLYDISGVTDWAEGVDNSDSDKFKISASAALGTSDALTIDSSLNTTFGGSVTATTTIDAGGNITATKSASGANVDVKATNGSNTASSNARLVASVAGASANDPVTLYDVNGVTNWISGIDNSDSDKFKISSSAALGTNDRLTIDTSGNVTVGGTVTVGALGGTGVVDSTQLAADSVDDTKVGNRVPRIYRRQGGSATDWSVAGTTTQTPGMVVEYMGVINKSFTSATVVSQAVTFPVAFSQTPIVTFSLGPTQSFSGGGNISYLSYSSVSTTGFTLNVTFTAANTGNLDFTWRATGTE